MKTAFQKVESAVLTSVQGLTVAEVSELRRRLHDAGVHYRVVKNTLAKKAVKGTPFEADQWELYHLDQDFNELHDLGPEQPVKLQEMIGRWFADAGAYKVLPLNDTRARFVGRNPSSLAARPARGPRAGPGTGGLR